MSKMTFKAISTSTELFFLVKTPNATMISNVIQSEGRKCLSLIEVVGTASKGEM